MTNRDALTVNEAELSDEQIRGFITSLEARLEKRPAPNTGLTFRSGEQAFLYMRNPLGWWQQFCLGVAGIKYVRRFPTDRGND